MDHLDLGAEEFRHGRALPRGGRDAAVHVGQPVQQVGVLGADAQAGVDAAGRELGVEGDVVAFPAVVPLDEMQLPCAGPDVAQEQRLAPARVDADDVRREAALAQGQRGACGPFAAQDLGLELARPGVDVGRAAAQDLVARAGHTGQIACRGLQHQRTDFMAGLHQGRCEVNVLARKILVNEE